MELDLDPYGSKEGIYHVVSATRGAILTAENVNLRKCKVACINWFYLCKEVGENVDHLLLRYSLDKRKCAIC